MSGAALIHGEAFGGFGRSESTLVTKTEISEPLRAAGNYKPWASRGEYRGHLCAELHDPPADGDSRPVNGAEPGLDHRFNQDIDWDLQSRGMLHEPGTSSRG